MHSLVLLLGSNLGDRLEILDRAREKIGREIGHIKKFSPHFESEPWGYQSAYSFINQCLEVGTPYPPRACLEIALRIESQMGRIRGKMTDRTLDIDILFYEDEVIDEEGLVIPHPRMAERRFTLEPLAEILPEKIHPVKGLTVRELLDQCPDELRVVRLS